MANISSYLSTLRGTNDGKTIRNAIADITEAVNTDNNQVITLLGGLNPTAVAAAATTATTKAGEAAGSADDAADSEVAAAAQAGIATTKAAEALVSKNAAGTSETNAKTSETNSKASELAAAGSEATATTKAGESAASAAAALVSEQNAALRKAETQSIKDAAVLAMAGTTNLTELADARRGQASLGQKIDLIDTQLAEKATNTALASVASGSPKGVYATLELLQASYPTGNTNIYVVIADGKWYYWNGSAWTAGGIYQSTGSELGFIVSSTNIFNKTNIVIGEEVYSNGTFSAESKSAHTGYVEIPSLNNGSVYISGLTAYASGIGRYVWFYDSDKLTIGTSERIPIDSTEELFIIPDEAKYLAFSIYQRKTSAEIVDLSNIQVELSVKKSAYTEYKTSIITLNGYTLTTNSTMTTPPKTKGKNLLVFGDSISETATVSDDGSTYTEGLRSNWPAFSRVSLQIGQMWNYAKSGAKYKDWETQTARQKISHQITTAIANNRPADLIVIAAGTNDNNDIMGNYATAMSKSTLNDLDRTNLYEALRWAFWTLHLNYPNAICFVVLPIQRALREQPVELITAITMMAKRYNFIIIDALSESGIVREFEIIDAAGRDLYDGLHPNSSGQLKMSELINSAILNYLNNAN